MTSTAGEIDPFFHLRKDAGVLIGIPVRDDEGRFHMWIRQGESWLRIQPADLVESDYFGKTAASPEDVFFGFIDFMYQRCRNPATLRRMDCVRNDMHNLAACMRKIELYHDELSSKGHEVRRFVTTEIEYVVGVCRSLFDLLQIIAVDLWDGVTLLDPGAKKTSLNTSFADMALQGEKARSPESLREKYGLTPRWAEFYANEADFFKKIRKFRNDIDHGGMTPEIIFNTPRGFAVNANSKPFAQFGIWKPETFLKNDLAPVRPVIAHIISQTFGAMNRFVEMINGEIKFPDEIAPGYRVFMRGPYIDRLAKLTDYLDKEIWDETAIS